MGQTASEVYPHVNICRSDSHYPLHTFSGWWCMASCYRRSILVVTYAANPASQLHDDKAKTGIMSSVKAPQSGLPIRARHELGGKPESKCPPYRNCYHRTHESGCTHNCVYAPESKAHTSLRSSHHQHHDVVQPPNMCPGMHDDIRTTCTKSKLSRHS